MKRCEEIEVMLGDHLENRLPPDEVTRVELHLAECAHCRAACQQLVELRTLVADLPRALEPDRDLWPRILLEVAARPIRRRRGLLLSWRAFSVAASVLVAVGALSLIFTSRPNSRTNGPVAANDGRALSPASRSVPSEVAKAEQAYMAAANDFLAHLQSAEAALTPDARRLLEGNLDITNRAISDIKSAFERQPTDLALARQLLVAHERRVELLQYVTQLTFSNRNGG